jgi:anti-sigma regulatory factor (Ser/Thr protein kinase)
MNQVERRFPRDIDALEQIHDFVESAVETMSIEASNSHWVEFVVQELFTNMVKYSTEGRKEISVRLDLRAHDLVIRVMDFEVEAFDVTKAPDVAIEHWVTQDRVGGLGLHLVKQIADTISYKYENRTSVITVTRRVESGSGAAS